MRTPAKLLIAAGLLAAAAGLAGCEEDPAAAPAAPAPTVAVPASAGTGSDGLTVRYLDRDGSVTTLPVEDFPR